MASIEVEIVNGDIYNPRKDVKATSWFRLENRWWRDHKFDGKSNDVRMVWIAILSIGSELRKHRFIISPRLIAATLGVEEKVVLEAIEFFQSIQCLIVHVTRTSRRRNADDTRTIRRRYADVPLRTRRTDETDENGSSDPPEPALPPEALLWNQLVPSLPKIRAWNEDRKKAFAKLMEKFTRDDWEAVCRKCEASDFLSGRSEKWNGAGVDWVLNRKNFVKVLEGNYDNKLRAVGDSFSGVAHV